MRATTLLAIAITWLITTAASAQELRMPRLQNGQIVNPVPTPAPPTAVQRDLNVGPVKVQPDYPPPKVNVIVQCGPNIQNGRVVCN
jgi:hypothetical protein